jgi:hypothetical protein
MIHVTLLSPFNFEMDPRPFGKRWAPVQCVCVRINRSFTVLVQSTRGRSKGWARHGAKL